MEFGQTRERSSSKNTRIFRSAVIFGRALNWKMCLQLTGRQNPLVWLNLKNCGNCTLKGNGCTPFTKEKYLMNVKILLLDIETSPKKGYFWRVWKENIPPIMLQQDTRIISFAAKFFDRDKIFYQDIQGAINNKGEKLLLKYLWVLWNQSDVIVAHNGRAFDIPTVLTRFVSYGFKPPKPPRYYDTFLEAKKHFNFTYNRLEHLAIALGCKVKKYKHRKFPGDELWVECLKNNPEAWKEMREYNTQDVIVLEQVYKKLRPWSDSHPNIALMNDRPGCPVCGSQKVQRRGVQVNKTLKKARFQCQDCGHWFSDPLSAKDKNGKVLRWSPE
jgi:DNA polymerase elongation subunit (family B)